MIERVWHPYWLWEEVPFNMWGQVDNRGHYLNMAVEFTGSPNIYGEFMQRVVLNWPKSCEHNLSNKTQNRQAWIGHAACALAFQCPEDIVRKAWSFLTDRQQIEANKKADEAIDLWERSYAQT